jgi:hypothetical protein
MGSLVAKWFGHLLRREQPAPSPYWWVLELPDREQKLYRRFYGDPENRIKHMHKAAASIDAFEARMDAEIAI